MCTLKAVEDDSFKGADLVHPGGKLPYQMAKIPSSQFLINKV